jgi:cell division initiation protein
VKLTPLDIRKQEFKKVMRGFDPEEVDAFMSMVADEMELIIREKNQLNDELIKLRTQLKDYQQVEHTLRDTLVKAQNTVDESRANSRREAQILIQEAELQADTIIKDAREELLHLRNEISLIKAQKESFTSRLRHLLESQIELLDVLQMDESTEMARFDTMKAKRERLARQVEGAEGRPEESAGIHEPRIVRGEKKFDQPPGAGQTSVETHPGQPDEQKEKGGDKISDQFIL